MVRYASELIFGNCDGHVLGGYGTVILNISGGPSGPHACFEKYILTVLEFRKNGMHWHFTLLGRWSLIL